MATTIRATVHVPLDIDRVWDVWVDAARYPQWQSGLLAVRDLDGLVSETGTTYVLDHGPRLQRQVRVVTAERPSLHVIEQAGVGIRDETVATFEPEGDGTRLTLVTYAHLNPVMRVLARLDRRSRIEQEFRRELDRFAELAMRIPPPVSLGGLYLAEAGAMRRRVVVIAADDDVVHIRLEPGHLRDRDPDTAIPVAPKPLGDQLDLWPIPPPLRASIDATATGLPFLRRDGGHGVAHLALSLSAWADAAPREIGRGAVTVEDSDAVAAWEQRPGPTVGGDANLDLAPLCTLRLGLNPDGREQWAVAKVLRTEILKIHLAIYANRWPERPEQVRPWELLSQAPPQEAVAAPSAEAFGAQAISIGHVPLMRAAFTAGMPRFAGVTTLEYDELEGYRVWREAQGGYFTSLEPIAAFNTADLT